MKVLLVQHGVATTKEEDPQRPLTFEGVQTTKKMAAWLGKQVTDIGEIQHSGKKRAAQTAEIFANRLAPATGVKEVAGLGPNDDVHSYVEQLKGKGGSIMIVGHLPFLDKLAGLLIAGDQSETVVSFVNSGIVCLASDQGGWLVSWCITPDIISDK